MIFHNCHHTNELSQLVYRPAKSFSDLDRSVIVAECTQDLKNYKSIAKVNNLNPEILKSWMGKAGLKIPSFDKTKFVKPCVDGEISPTHLSKSKNVSPSTIRYWVKRSGYTLPGKYATNPISKNAKSLHFPKLHLLK